ncbi:MAG: hypothetical protein ABI273_09085 [Lacunisphaera sp.]
MEVKINANKCEEATMQIARILRGPFKSVAKDVSKDYGGTMQHLWIDFELIEDHAERRPSWPFRFQKKVGGSVSRLTGQPVPIYNNVGHYGISPTNKRSQAVHFTQQRIAAKSTAMFPFFSGAFGQQCTF